MKRLHVFLGVLSLLLLSCSPAPKQLVIDSFEGELTKETVDFGAGEGSVLRVSADKTLKVCGEQSVKLDYRLGRSSYMWVARGYDLDVKGAAQWLLKPQEIKWAKYNAVSFYMYGRNSQAVFAFDLKDRGGELWRFIVDDDFQGWKQIICPFANFFPRSDWQPQTAAVNEVLDFPIMSFQFEPRLPGRGICNFDCVQLLRVKK